MTKTFQTNVYEIREIIPKIYSDQMPLHVLSEISIVTIACLREYSSAVSSCWITVKHIYFDV